MDQTSHSKPEILAPAGGQDALRAAIANGADAVYLGVERLNARRGAENFRLASLAETCRFAHLRGVRLYLTVNVVILDSEIADALSLVDTAWAAGVDAVIVQDLGLLAAVRAHLPHVRIHASTQVNAHNTLTVRALAGLGVSRVTLAREVSIEEIGVFVRHGGAEIEMFVHGALCVCYSGQCLMSSLIGGRSANRGLCAQPCRLPYELVDESGAVIASAGQHLLSPKDLAGIAALPQLVDVGVTALKIEGRMKSADYVALVTGVYRAALDRAAADPEAFEVRDGEMSVLSESFTRGFTQAYMIGERGNEMMSLKRPNNRGVLVGRVVAVEDGRATIVLETQVDAADTIEFWTSSGRFAQPVGALMRAGVETAWASAGERVSVAIEEPVTSGDRVFRVRNAALHSAAQRTFDSASDAGSLALAFTVRVLVGEPLRVEVVDDIGRFGSAEGPVVEPARTKAVTAEEVSQHVGRLGGTRYRIGRWDVELSTAAGVGFSALHSVRRAAIAAYEDAVLAQWSAREEVRPTLRLLPRPTRRSDDVRVVVETANIEVARACMHAGATRVHVPTSALSREVGLADGIVPLISRIIHDREAAAALAFALPGKVVETGNLGVLGEAVAMGAHVEAHWSLNALNGLAVNQLADLGASFVWLSPELSGKQIAAVADASRVPVGVTVYGRQEMMVTEHCVLMAEGECEQRCASCSRRNGRRALKDRKGFVFPVMTDVTGRSHVYNSVSLDVVSALPDLVDNGIAAVRIDAHTLSPEIAAEAVAYVSSVLEDLRQGREPRIRPRHGATTGHFFRGLT